MAYVFDCIVVGGGPAGMMAAGMCAERGFDVLIIEKNKSLGKKLRITGKGRCNVTNDTDPAGVLDNIISGKKFLMSAINRFSPRDTINFFEELGVPLKTERGNRVFPQSDNALDIVDAMRKYLSQTGVKLLCDTVKDIIVSDGEIKGVVTEGGRKFVSKTVIVATGGKSYSVTGSTGDGYRFARKAGHNITDIKPALVPVNTEEKWVREMQGLSLKNVKLSVYDGEKCVFSDMGEMLFTHFGVSGPLVLSASCQMQDISDKKYVMSVDFKPALDEKTLDTRILRDFNEKSNKDFINCLSGILPSAAIPVFVKLSGIDPRKKVNLVTREERKKLLFLLKGLEFHAESFRPINEAIVTAGGVDTKEINPATMESKLVRGLYFAGEVMDVHGYTGGFNLQIAFASGAAAGKSVLKNEK